MIRYLFRLLASFFTRVFDFFIRGVVFLIRQFVLFIRQLVFFIKQLVFFLIRQLKSLYRQLVFFIKQLVSFFIRQLNSLYRQLNFFFTRVLVPFINETIVPSLPEQFFSFLFNVSITAAAAGSGVYIYINFSNAVLLSSEEIDERIDERIDKRIDDLKAQIDSISNMIIENKMAIREISADINKLSRNLSSIPNIVDRAEDNIEGILADINATFLNATAENKIAIEKISVKIDSISNTTARNERAIGDISADISSVSNYVVNNINKTLAFAIHTKTVEIDQMNQTINQIMSQAKDQGKKMYRSNQEKYQEYIDALLKRQGQLEKEGKELRQKRDEFLKDPLKPLNMYNNDPDEIASSSNSIEEFNRAQDKFIVYITDPKTKNLPKAIPLIVNNRAVLLNRAVPVRREMGKMSSSSSSCPSRGQGIFLGELLDPKTRNPFSIYNSNQPFFLNNGIGLNNRCFLYLP